MNSMARSWLSIMTVLAHGARKHNVTEVAGWDPTLLDTHMSKALSHIDEKIKGKLADEETGESPLAHAAARLFLALMLEQERPPT